MGLKKADCGHIETLVRGVHVQDGMLLLCQTKGDPNTYLPGGHVDFGEQARRALVREIEEEMGLASTCGAFLGAVEHGFMQKGCMHYELNLLFVLEVCGLDPAVDPPSEEAHLRFVWHPFAELGSARLEPAALCGVLSEWLCGRPGWSSSGTLVPETSNPS